MTSRVARWATWSIGTVLFLASAYAQGPTVAADSYIQSGTSASTNFGALANVLVGPATGATQNRGLVQFDLSALSGVGAGDIQKAVLWVYVNRVTTSGALDVSAINGSWTESTVTSNAAPAFDAAIQGTIPVTAAGQWIGLDLTTLAGVWLATPSTNHGVVISASVTAASTSVSLDAKENTATSHPAQLQIIFNGPAGATGPLGPAGPSGAQGPSGPEGPSGPAGVAGATGASGPSGAAGASGPSGAAGVAGASGPSGAAGAAGASGPSGPAGAAGASGPSGAAGAAGASGPSGPAGAAGSSGPSGPAGPSGAGGSVGAAGPSGPSGLSVTGATGPSGPSGPSGANGAAGGGIYSVPHTPLGTTIGLSIQNTNLSTAADAPLITTLMSTACSLTMSAYSTVTGAVLTVRTGSAPTGLTNSGASCTASSANAQMSCTGFPLAISANSFVNLAYNNTAASTGIFTFVKCQ